MSINSGGKGPNTLIPGSWVTQPKLPESARDQAAAASSPPYSAGSQEFSLFGVVHELLVLTLAFASGPRFRAIPAINGNLPPVVQRRIDNAKAAEMWVTCVFRQSGFNPAEHLVRDQRLEIQILLRRQITPRTITHIFRFRSSAQLLYRTPAPSYSFHTDQRTLSY